ncbi:Lrp/AsnC family transcriptional regulator [Rhizobium sp. L1K21]|uniref:Lrp/AsnC family transcriptional regulator n=1 Tax=Rhizobium sp. L1K21 TaxID=2954933 RepID=UPI00209268F1|nr:Lrp/AsnC family transcriptional regulator [Rhizobium sp. L1K21]MCO6186222.1 Lrp/AsnC family transcriptional regulator [Rhizobium sp. L1K21]
MDETDKKLITLLRQNGRRSVSDLALETGLARATVRSRLERLEADGDIIGYTVILRADAFEAPVRAMMLIEVTGGSGDRVGAYLGSFPELTAIHKTNGKWDFIAEIGTDSLIQLDTVLEKIRRIPGISTSETNILLATPKSTHARL